MLTTTTDSLQGRQIEDYLGVVAGQAIYGANVFRDLFAGITDFLGGRSGAYESVLRGGMEEAMKDMRERASELGANAVVGVSVDYEAVGTEGTMLMVAVSGTAVRVR